MERVGTVIIGAGVIGLAVARALARAGQAPLVLEHESRFGEHLSSRNSEVIHGGLYYPPASLKARACVRGNILLHEYCSARNIAHRRCGKLIVAGPGQAFALQRLQDNALASGARGLAILDRRALRREEPWLTGEQALYSTYSGIIDSHGLMASLAREAEDGGALLAPRHQVTAVRCARGDFRLLVQTPDGTMELGCERLINAAGLGAVPLVAAMEGFPDQQRPEQEFAKGNYFTLNGPAPSERLIYPLPQEHGLGVHLTLDLAGRARFGPDVEWVATPDYHVDPARRPAFEQAIRQYWPTLPKRALRPDYAGVRPKLRMHGEPYPDFLIQDHRDHGLDGLINLLGIESPGLTAALALAENVARI
ncbi:NAD(P)/FAD-dependent oxidoreductase [Alloalcanivorax sp. C16-2]|uniref:NAD(P)/FAD-dependent oxidoreductase n=1 Tax=Alloalcanivorax sp. C16-2 TaxID=3390052 RepID=UPI003970927C